MKLDELSSRKSLEGVFQRGILIFSGAILVVVMEQLRQYLTQHVAVGSIGWIDLALLSIFLGVSTGHYLGKALADGEPKLTYVYLGLSLSLSYGVFSKAGGELAFALPEESLAFVIPGLMSFMIVAHTMNIIDDHQAVEDLISLMSNELTGLAVALVTFLNYVVPVAQYLYQVIVG